MESVIQFVSSLCVYAVVQLVDEPQRSALGPILLGAWEGTSMYYVYNSLHSPLLYGAYALRLLFYLNLSQNPIAIGHMVVWTVLAVLFSETLNSHHGHDTSSERRKRRREARRSEYTEVRRAERVPFVQARPPSPPSPLDPTSTLSSVRSSTTVSTPLVLDSRSPLSNPHPASQNTLFLTAEPPTRPSIQEAPIATEPNLVFRAPSSATTSPSPLPPTQHSLYPPGALLSPISLTFSRISDDIDTPIPSYAPNPSPPPVMPFPEQRPNLPAHQSSPPRKRDIPRPSSARPQVAGNASLVAAPVRPPPQPREPQTLRPASARPVALRPSVVGSMASPVLTRASTTVAAVVQPIPVPAPSIMTSSESDASRTASPVSSVTPVPLAPTPLPSQPQGQSVQRSLSYRNNRPPSIRTADLQSSNASSTASPTPSIVPPPVPNYVRSPGRVFPPVAPIAPASVPDIQEVQRPPSVRPVDLNSSADSRISSPIAPAPIAAIFPSFPEPEVQSPPIRPRTTSNPKSPAVTYPPVVSPKPDLMRARGPSFSRDRPPLARAPSIPPLPVPMVRPRLQSNGRRESLPHEGPLSAMEHLQSDFPNIGGLIGSPIGHTVLFQPATIVEVDDPSTTTTNAHTVLSPSLSPGSARSGTPPDSPMSYDDGDPLQTPFGSPADRAGHAGGPSRRRRPMSDDPLMTPQAMSDGSLSDEDSGRPMPSIASRLLGNRPENSAAIPVPVPSTMSSRPAPAGPSKPTVPPAPAMAAASSGDTVLSDISDEANGAARARQLRQDAWDEEARRKTLQQSHQAALRNGDQHQAFMLAGEIEESTEKIRKWHEKAQRRHLHARNPTDTLVGVEIVDVHGLLVAEAVKQTEKAFRQVLLENRKSLKVIAGKGLHSKDGVAKLKPAIQAAMAKHGISCSVDPKNAGQLILSSSWVS